ncbi:MAG: NAD(P)/FAD-dependent oxidoreductase [Gammaproteobacteria bacterium]|nr:NAD(P)/FAD-dependent oxidoreductase [Gammaproteobacteria bacterium]
MSDKTQTTHLDAVIVGAGFAGMYMLHKLRNLGFSVRVLEAAHDVGGTWYWNRYPGARCDVPSMEYSYSFSDELQQEWNWTEVMAGQPEILEYAAEVADRFALRSDIQFDTKVSDVIYDEVSNHWRLTTDKGESIKARFCIMATGCLSVPNIPTIEGAANFKGAIYHTGEWPHEGVDFTGVTVGIIGTGSSGVQAIPLIAEQAQQLTVFQRTPNYTMPAHNKPLTNEFRRDAKSNYAEIRQRQRESQAGIVSYGFGLGGAETAKPTDSIMRTTKQQRMVLVDKKGFRAIHQFMDIDSDMNANEMACDMYREQLGRIVEEPKTAEGLMPRDYPIGCKRPVIDSNYYQTFNRSNVTLVDLRQGGIEKITQTGIRTAQGHFEFDALIYATGFDAMTGALLRMNIRGRDGVVLSDTWQAGPRTYLGLQISGFPNLFTITGPGSPSVLSNMMVSIEQHVDWIGNCISHMKQNHLQTIEATEQAVEQWIDHVNEVADGTMLTAPSCNSWYLGANIPGKPRIFMPYVGGVGAYREKCKEVANNNYEGFEFSGFGDH